MLKYVVSLICVLFVLSGVFAIEDAEALLAPEPEYTKTETIQGKITSDYLKKGGGKVTIYKGKTPVMKHIPDKEAIDRLLELIEGEKQVSQP